MSDAIALIALILGVVGIALFLFGLYRFGEQRGYDRGWFDCNGMQGHRDLR